MQLVVYSWFTPLVIYSWSTRGLYKNQYHHSLLLASPCASRHPRDLRYYYYYHYSKYHQYHDSTHRATSEQLHRCLDAHGRDTGLPPPYIIELQYQVHPRESSDTTGGYSKQCQLRLFIRAIYELFLLMSHIQRVQYETSRAEEREEHSPAFGGEDDRLPVPEKCTDAWGGVYVPHSFELNKSRANRGCTRNTGKKVARAISNTVRPTYVSGIHAVAGL
eukprot:scaffold38691_cov36-Attheya_sp.AAC.1